MKITVGGNRLGSGQKMKGNIKDYNRSTHNLSEKFASSAASGVLYPCLCKLATRGDSFDIEINADARTIPTKGPLFGSFKMQVDVFQCPVRLYQALLHNNPLALGLNMAQVKFPVIDIRAKHHNTSLNDEGEFSKSCLLKYLGMSGLGTAKIPQNTGYIGRKINALPLLSYYDIYKTYYANKQEESGYIITGDEGETEKQIVKAWGQITNIANKIDTKIYGSYNVLSTDGLTLYIQLDGIYNEDTYENINVSINSISDDSEQIISLADMEDVSAYVSSEVNNIGTLIQLALTSTTFETIADNEGWENPNIISISIGGLSVTEYATEKLVLREFDLQNIDDMRYELLSHHTLGSAYEIGYNGDWNITSGEDSDGMPYAANFRYTTEDAPQEALKVAASYNHLFPMNGLALKTYQNDIYNNWLNTEWIEGEYGINELTKVTIDENGSFSMDSLNFAQKLYDMLNRIAVSGNTYEDWQDVVYEEVKRKQIESPIYCGGLSQEVMFDEIVQTAPASVGGETSELGTLGGRGRLIERSRKGGKIHIKCDEACFIIAIVSLTPRIFYTQGNEFYLTEIFSMDDLHKPAMDGIGFQDLIGERLAWFNTVLNNDGSSSDIFHRSRIGKLPAWIEYMTSYDKAYGDFAENYGKGYMILNRNFESVLTDGTGGTVKGALSSNIKDATTYVDPSKYNYAFAYTELEAQNFWLEIAFNIKARRLMSARIIPNV